MSLCSEANNSQICTVRSLWSLDIWRKMKFHQPAWGIAVNWGSCQARELRLREGTTHSGVSLGPFPDTRWTLSSLASDLGTLGELLTLASFSDLMTGFGLCYPMSASGRHGVGAGSKRAFVRSWFPGERVDT